MKVEFNTASWETDKLKDDLEYLKNTFGLPCEIEETINACREPRAPNDPAIAFFGKNEVKTGIPVVEINTQYFNEKKEKRILVLLHEIIHCCQRANGLKKVNEKYMINLADRLNSIIVEYLKNHPRDEKFYVLRESVKAVGLFSSWIFEIWDDMHLKTNYSQVLEQKLELTFEKINQEINADSFKDYECWAKYPVFINLVRVYYLEKISEGYDISKKFQDLRSRWENKLKDITDTKEFKEIMNNLEALTRIEDYNNSDTSTMEKSYDSLIERMITDATEIIDK